MRPQISKKSAATCQRQVKAFYVAHAGRRRSPAARASFVVHVPEQVDVKAIRRRLGLSQRRFAERFGFKFDAAQDWEQGRQRPEGAARAFLRVIEREPEAVERALTPKPRKRRISVQATAD